MIEGVGRLFRALTPGGILFLDVASDGVDGTIDRWQAHNAGGSAMTLAECAQIVRAAGFEQPQTPPGAPIAYCRRP